MGISAALAGAHRRALALDLHCHRSTLNVGPALSDRSQSRRRPTPPTADCHRERETNVGRVIRCAVLAAVAAGCLSASVSGAGEYPLALTLDMKAGNTTATVTTSVTIRVDRAMEPNRWTRVTDALKFNGYGAFLNTLRTLPAIGAIDIGKRHVDLRYSHEEPTAEGRRLILVADRPMFFLAADESKSRAGYELTIVELIVDAKNQFVSGRMTGAARVKPSPDGVQLDNFAEAPIPLTARPK
jgi:hypothetical protein